MRYAAGDDLGAQHVRLGIDIEYELRPRTRVELAGPPCGRAAREEQSDVHGEIATTGHRGSLAWVRLRDLRAGTMLFDRVPDIPGPLPVPGIRRRRILREGPP